MEISWGYNQPCAMVATVGIPCHVATWHGILMD